MIVGASNGLIEILMEDAYEKITLYGTIHLETAKIATGTASFVIKDGITRLTLNH